MNNDKDKKIAELENRISELERTLSTVSNSYALHTHTGRDGSIKQVQTIELNPGQGYSAGSMTWLDATGVLPPAQTLEGTRFIAALAVGGDSDGANGSGNMQINYDHYSALTTSFIYAYRKPVNFGSTGVVASGGSTLGQSSYIFEVDALAGSFVNVQDPATANVSFETYVITSNTETVITVAGSWGFSASNANFEVFQAVYLGSANFPYKRLYTTDTTAGGVRFGQGNTAGGQNGLLYMSGQSLKWRQPDGTDTTIDTTP